MEQLWPLRHANVQSWTWRALQEDIWKDTDISDKEEKCKKIKDFIYE